MQDGIQDGGLWGPDELVDSVKKHDNATERICERYGLKIKSRVIMMKNSFRRSLTSLLVLGESPLKTITVDKVNCVRKSMK